MIEVDVERRLGRFRLDVRFSAEAPILGLFGRSGSGKTSVINAISKASSLVVKAARPSAAAPASSRKVTRACL